MRSKLTTILALLALGGCDMSEERAAEGNGPVPAETGRKTKAQADAEAANLLGLGNGAGNGQAAADPAGKSGDSSSSTDDAMIMD